MISFLLVFDLLLISMVMLEWLRWLMVWNIFCIVGVLLMIFGVCVWFVGSFRFCCFWVCWLVCLIREIVLLMLNGLGRYLKVLFW